MNGNDRTKKQVERIADFLDRLFGETDQMDLEEVDLLYEEVAQGKDPRLILHDLASKAAAQYRLRGDKVPVHVRTVFDATKDSSWSKAGPEALSRHLEALLAPSWKPTKQVSYAFRDKGELSDEDRKILEDASREVQEDWEES